jgi:hypothetical protein
MSQCSICQCPNCEEIEEAFVNWGSTPDMSERYSVSRDAIYRHAHAFGLFRKRTRNIKRALEPIIERGERMKYGFTPGAFVSAIRAYATIVRQEQQDESVQAPNFKQLFARMSQEEREAFARDASLPEWFSAAIGATADDGEEGEKASQVTETTRVQ